MSTERSLAESWVNEWNKAEHKMRIWRMEKLQRMKGEDWLMSPGPLATLHYQEAQLCWLSGAYVSTVVMSALAFEEILRKGLRRVNISSMGLSDELKVDDATFVQLIEHASAERWITRIEARKLTTLRKALRNPYVHTKGKEGPGKNGPLPQSLYDSISELKAANPSVESGSVVADALNALETLVRYFPAISTRVSFLSCQPESQK